MRIDDMLDAAREILAFTAGMTREDFENNPTTTRAVKFNLIIIGEAARHVPSHVAARYAALPLVDIRGKRNYLVHEYESVDLDIVWDTIHTDIEPLIQTLATILERES